MDNYIIAVLMGLLEGLTEFLPISSSGHLALAGNFLNFSGAKAHTFEIVIQVGAILAVVTLYWREFLGLVLPGKNANGFSGWRGIYLLVLTTAPVCICGLLFHSLIKRWLFGPLPIVVFLVIGSICMFLVERKEKRPASAKLHEISPKLALGVGIAQCFALCPGFSRSAATIMGGLVCGASRNLAVQYSFIAAVPVMFAASGYDIYKNLNLFTAADLSFFIVGTICAYVAGILSIRFCIALLSKTSLKPFAIYRILLAAIVWIVLVK